MEEKKATWWRWPLVPVAAVCGYAAGALAIVALAWVQSLIMGHNPWGSLEPLAAGAVGGFGCVGAACETAPRSRAVVAVVVATTITVGNLMGAAAAWAYGGGLMPEAVLSGVGAILGSIAGAVKNR